MKEKQKGKRKGIHISEKKTRQNVQNSEKNTVGNREGKQQQQQWKRNNRCEDKAVEVLTIEPNGTKGAIVISG